jgi:hypothetical protein
MHRRFRVYPESDATHMVLVVVVLRPPREETWGSGLVPGTGRIQRHVRRSRSKDIDRMTSLRNHGCALIARVASFQQGSTSKGIAFGKDCPGPG